MECCACGDGRRFQRLREVVTRGISVKGSLPKRSRRSASLSRGIQTAREWSVVAKPTHRSLTRRVSASTSRVPDVNRAALCYISQGERKRGRCSKMTAPKAAHYAFPDFDPIVDRLIASRSAIETDRSLVLKAKPDLTYKDVRLVAFTHLYHNVDYALVSIRLLNDFLLPSDNEWWQQPKQQALFGSYNDWYREAIANSFNNAYVKNAFMHHLFGNIENTFRQLLRKVDPSAANNATADITSVFRALCSRIGNTPSESEELLKLLRLSRNTIHSNGVFYPQNQQDDQVTYKGTTYDFIHTKPVKFLNWNFLIDRLDDVRELFTAIITNPNIIGIADEIPDLFAENR